MSIVGELIRDLDAVEYGDISAINCADWKDYRTCRGAASKPQIHRILDLLMDVDADEDERDDAVYDGVWDLLMHQYTMYSATPLALHYLLSTTSDSSRSNIRDAHAFVKYCASQGSGGIFLTHAEIAANKLGTLPIFRIEDVLKAHA